MTGSPTLVQRLSAAVARIWPGELVDSVSLYRFAHAAYRWAPLPSSWKRRLAGLLFAHLPGLREARLLARARIGRDEKIAHLSRAANECRDAQGLLLQARRRILVIEHRIPTPDRTSGALRLSGMLSIIAGEGWEITFVSANDKARYHWLLDDIHAELPPYEHRLEALGAQILYGPEALAGHLVKEGGTYLCALLAYPEIMFEYAPLVRAYAPNATLVYDTVDLHGVRFAREAAIRNDDKALRDRAERYDHMERANIDSADLVIAITPDEQARIERRSPGVASVVIPNIHTVTQSAPACADRGGLVFIGHYLHTPNVDAMVFFVNEVLPQLDALCGDAELFMLGSSMTDRVRALGSSRVHAVGFVEDPAEWFDRARVFVAPLRYGAGMKGKIGHAMSLGLPVVTTTIGAEGMGLEPGRHVLVADDPRGFAKAVARLIEDDELWLAMARAGLDHARRNLSVVAATAPLRHVLDHRKPARRDDWARP